MADIRTLADRLKARFEAAVLPCSVERGEVTLELSAEQLLRVCRALREEPEFAFELLLDVCGVDYIAYGQSEWSTDTVSDTGFSRGVAAPGELPTQFRSRRRFAVVYHLLSVSNNQRLRVRVFADDDEFPRVDSVTSVWSSADWYEREAFDLFGIVFEGHPDLRRLLTDYGFIGHPFRKDFPLSGQVEMRYDPGRRRVVYEPVSIEPRVLVPRVIRHDNRYAARPEGKPSDA